MGNTGHAATIGRPSPLAAVKRALARKQRLEKSLSRATGERKASLEAELARLDSDIAEVRAALAPPAIDATGAVIDATGAAIDGTEAAIDETLPWIDKTGEPDPA